MIVMIKNLNSWLIYYLQKDFCIFGIGDNILLEKKKNYDVLIDLLHSILLKYGSGEKKN